jgi:hypothetical protein
MLAEVAMADAKLPVFRVVTRARLSTHPQTSQDSTNRHTVPTAPLHPRRIQSSRPLPTVCAASIRAFQICPITSFGLAGALTKSAT